MRYRKVLFVVFAGLAFIVGGSLVIVPIAAAASPTEAVVVHVENPPAFGWIDRLFVFGDSLANGYGATAIERGPAECLEKHFGIAAMNFARDGDLSEDAHKVMQVQLALYHPKLIFISAGGNDVFYADTVSAQKTLHEMRAIFDLALSTGAVVAYLALDPPREWIVRHIPEEHQADRRLVQVSEFALEMGVIVVDGMRDLWLNDDMMGDDEIHPNDRGYDVVCRRMIETIMIPE